VLLHRLYCLILKRDDGWLPRRKELVECVKAGPEGPASVKLCVCFVL